jgi:hypothetical protein
VVKNMAALREAWEDGYEAIIAIDIGDKARARDYLAKGLEPAAKAWPAGTKAAFALAVVYLELIEAAA